MYLKQKMRRGISAALVAAMTAGNILTVPAAPTEEGMPNVKNTVETESYQAELNLSDGEMVFKNKVRGEKEWNTADKAMQYPPEKISKIFCDPCIGFIITYLFSLFHTQAVD